MRRPDPSSNNHESIDVLIVDANASDASKTSQALRRSRPGISTVRVAHAEQALRLMLERGLFTAAPQLPGLILLDLALADAKALLQRLRTEERTRHIPVVVLSSGCAPAELADSAAAGATAYVVKTADAAAYEVTLAEILCNCLERATKSPQGPHRGTLSKRGTCSEKSRNSFSHTHASNRCSSHRALTRRRAKDSHRYQA
jgi:two-component system response regulator